MGTANTNALVATLLAMAGQRNVITIPRAFVQFTGDLESAMMLNQLLYWKPRAHGETIYKTDSEWTEELCLTRYAVRKARECLVNMGFLAVEVHHVRGAPAVHYDINYDVLVERWTSWLQGQEVKCENELYPPDSKVRKRTLPKESSSNPDRVKFENAQTMNHRVPTEITDSKIGGGGGAPAHKKETARHVPYLLNKGMVTAAEFTALDPDTAIADFEARRKAGIPIGTIVETWRLTPPTPGAIYEQQRLLPGDLPPDRPRRSAVGAQRGSYTPTGGADLRDPGWQDRLIADAEARAETEL